MKKNLIFMHSIALLTIISLSCNKEPDSTPEYLLDQVTVASDSNLYTYNFSYDNKRRLTMIKAKDSRIELYYDDQDRLIRDVFYNKNGLKEFTRSYIGNTIQTRDRIYFLNDKNQVIDIKSAKETYLSKIAFESNGNIVSYREYYLGKLKSSTDYSYDNKNHPMLNVLGREYLFFVMEDSGYNLGYILDCNTLVNNVVEQQDDKGTKQQWITKLNYRYNESSFPTYRTDELEEVHYSYIQK